MIRTNHILTSLTFYLTVVGCTISLPAAGQERLAALVGDGSVMLRSPEGETLVSINPNTPLVPASILKIPLAHVALSTLGEDFRFETHFFRNERNDLLIRGLGDPFLVSEEIAQIVRTLAENGLQQVRRVVIDATAFEPNLDLPLERGSDQPYAARNSALAANFNTVNLAWTEKGRLVTGESQTPLTETARELGAQFSAGEAQRINLGEDPIVGLRQAQQLFLHFLAESGIGVTDNGFYQAAITDEWTLFYRHRSSRSLRDNLDGMLRYSNNFIANQVFLTLGAQTTGYPVTTDEARNVLQKRLAELYGSDYGTNEQFLLMIEGSGLAREQRSTASGMIHILEEFLPYAELLPDVGGVLRKSGTLTGVYNFAGYFRGSEGLYPFVVITNQASNNRAEVLEILRRRL